MGQIDGDEAYILTGRVLLDIADALNLLSRVYFNGKRDHSVVTTSNALNWEFGLIVPD